MNQSGLWTVIGASLGFLGAIAPQWLTTRGNRRQKWIELQAQTARELQEAIAGLEPLGALLSAARRVVESDDTSNSLGVKIQIQRQTDLVERLLAFKAGSRRAAILKVRIEDAMARQLASEMIDLAEQYARETDQKLYLDLHNSMGEKFTQANERLGEVIRRNA